MDGQQQGIAVQVVAGGEETLGHQQGIVVVKREAAVALSVGVGDNIVGFARQFEGHGRLLHIDHHRATLG